MPDTPPKTKPAQEPAQELTPASPAKEVASPTAAKATDPNQIAVSLRDDLGWDAVGCGGHGVGRNPTDALIDLTTGGSLDDGAPAKLTEADMADEIHNNNVIQLFMVKKLWVAQIGPVGRGIQCQGLTPTDAVKGLTKMIDEARWTFDRTWMPSAE